MASGVRFSINDKAAKAKVAALTKATQYPEEVYRTIGNTVVNRVRMCFRMGIDPWGSPWAPLKIRQGQPLRDTGRLQRSITARPDSTGVTIGTNVSYAPVHQFGATIKPKLKPMRYRVTDQQSSRFGQIVTTPGGRLVFPGPNGMIFAKQVTVPARPFLPIRQRAAAVALPPAWSVAVVNSLKGYFRNAINKGTV